MSKSIFCLGTGGSASQCSTADVAAAAAAAASCRTALTAGNRMSTGGASLGETQGRIDELSASFGSNLVTCCLETYRVTHQVSDYISLTLIWEFHHVAYVTCQFCQICCCLSRIHRVGGGI